MDTPQTKLFFSLFMANQNRIYTYIMMLVPNGPDADDIMQETATVMWQKFGDFRPGTSFSNWGIRIAHHKILDFRKKKKHSRVHFSQSKFEMFAHRAATVAEQVDDRLEALRYCIRELKEPDRQLLQLHYESGSTIKSIAERAGRSVQGLYKIMTRIHNQLMKCVNGKLAAERI
jgi:RNA polymerase sigma-70 factor (ECF subfamily)